MAHDYHRRRQNVHYQSVNQPGIVCGLGVRPISAIDRLKDQKDHRDGRWVQIQSGIAIDLAGNLIVVETPLPPYRIATELGAAEEATIYLVISYRDPEDMGLESAQQQYGQQLDLQQIQRQAHNNVVQEFFRIAAKIEPPGPLEVELCRFVLKEPVSADNPIRLPQDLFNPGENELNLNFRIPAQSRPQAVVRMAQTTHDDPLHGRNYLGLLFMSRAVEGLYPNLKALQPLRTEDTVEQVSLRSQEFRHNLPDYDVLYLTGQDGGLNLDETVLTALEDYLQHKGGVLVVDVPANATSLIQSVSGLAQRLGKSLQTQLNPFHPLLTQPFTFAALPAINGKSIKLAVSEGLILILGNLGSYWGPDRERTLARTDIRTAQEFGVNILHYAWRRRQLMGLMGETYTGQW
jgi:hypothetical protein